MATGLTRTHFPSILLLSFFFGSNLVVSRFSLGQFHPLGFVALRLPIAAFLALAWSRVQNGRFPTGRRIWLHGSIVGVFATAMPMMTFVSALGFQSSGVTALMIALTPVSAMIFAHFRLTSERMNLRKLLGAILSFAGVGILLVTGETGLGQPRWEGFALVAVGVGSNGFGIVHIRKHLQGMSSLDITAVRLIVAAAITFPIAVVSGGLDLSGVQWTGVIALIYGTLPGTLLGFMLYSFVTARFGPLKATQTEYLVPVVTVVIGALVLKEQITLAMITGMVVVFAGIAVATTRRRLRTSAGTA